MARVSYFEGAAQSGPQKVFLATPTYTGKLDAHYVNTLLHSLEKLRKLGITTNHYVMSQNCHVDDSRNSIVRDFLESDCTDLVFLDADVAWEPDALVKLIQGDRDVLAGVYPKRTDKESDFPVLVPPETDLQADQDGFVEVHGAPTGFMKIKRHVIEKMWDANEHQQFQAQGNKSHKPYRVIFERKIAEGRRWSGDYNFCRVWRNMGGKVFVDPEMYLYHIGEEVFQGTLGHNWKQKHGLMDLERKKMARKCFDQLRKGEITDDLWKKLIWAWNNPYTVDQGLLFTCYSLAKEIKGDILETGTGLTTLVMAVSNPDVTIHCLEHDTVWASATKYFAEEHGIKNIKVHYNPLKEFADGKWYDVDELPEKFDLALCDGPPRRISNRSIFYREMHEKIKNAIVLMDDADDDLAVKPIKEWAAGLKRDVTLLGTHRRFAISPTRKDDKCQQEEKAV